jgi:hypothetical protein
VRFDTSEVNRCHDGPIKEKKRIGMRRAEGFRKKETTGGWWGWGGWVERREDDVTFVRDVIGSAGTLLSRRNRER